MLPVRLVMLGAGVDRILLVHGMDDKEHGGTPAAGAAYASLTQGA
jgi:hypothetical protein